MIRSPLHYTVNSTDANMASWKFKVAFFNPSTIHDACQTVRIIEYPVYSECRHNMMLVLVVAAQGE